MGAARYAGSIGGLAFALGVGAAILGGTAVASADDSRPDHARAGPSAGSPRSDAGPRAAARAAEAPARAPATAFHRTRSASPTPAAPRTSLSVDPQLRWEDGILRGTVGATSSDSMVFSLVSPPSLGGKLGSDILTNRFLFGPQGQFSYLPYASTLTDPAQTETFTVLAAENTPFDQLLTGVPVVGLLARNALEFLHRTPILSELLAPVIGASQLVTFTVRPAEEAAGRPTAFTSLMPSFDTTSISVNYFPALDIVGGGSAPTVLLGPGLPGAGTTNPDNTFQFASLTPGIQVLRSDAWVSPDGGPGYDGGGGYNVITWDPRGEYASGGVLQLDNPFYEGRDVSAIISWAVGDSNPARAQVLLDGTGDPLIGMVGESYGGGIQLTAAGIDPRIDAIVPQLAWNSLLTSLYPNDNQFKTGVGAGLAIALALTGARVNTQLYEGIFTGVTLGWLSETSQALLSSSGPTVLLDQLHSPTLLFQGIEDTLFPLADSMTNAQAILANPYGVPVKLVWFCGGHGTCLDPLNPSQDDLGFIDNLRWLDQYVAGAPGDPADAIPAFQWYDQRGVYWSSDLLPFQDGFNRPVPYNTTGAGGLLGIVPVIGGSGPGSIADIPFFIGDGTPARNAINTAVTPPAGLQIVGSPQLSFAYTGVGTSRTVYAQLVDIASDRVLGNIVTPIPVTLDGHAHTVSLPMEAIAYTVGAGDSLTLQITSSASNYENVTSFGLIGVSDIALDLPIRAAGITDPAR